MPPTQVLERARPRYERLRGWGRDISRTADRRSLPAEARAYLERIEQTVGAKVGMVGIGPERTATIL
jgi:adenylosuccinate synthase